jgi:hypothetical protein
MSGPLVHAAGCKEAPQDHTGPCKTADMPGQFTAQDTQGLDDSLATPITDATRAHRDEAVDHPAHYGGADNPYEAIKVIEAWNLGFCLGNTVKYISRAGKKADVLEDLKKARWYLDRQIANMEHFGSAK